MGAVDRGYSGRYRIIERIAEGGMAVVDLAEATGPGGFRRELVLKRIRPRFSRDLRFARMFEDEARIISQLNHPNIVHIYEFGKIDDEYFLAMEYVPGVDLTTLTGRLSSSGERFPIAQAVFIVIEVCRALDYAHRKRGPDGRALDIIHRDVSPANVLISHEGAVKLVDFGIARFAERQEQTLDGVIKGKVAFMSPEQVRGEPLDSRTDLFSAAIILYELLAGEHPFAAATDMDTIDRAMHHRWPPPGQFAPDVPPGLDAIVMKATDRDRFERYETAADLAYDLEGFLFDARLRASASELSALMRRLYGDESARNEPAPPQVKVSVDGVVASEIRRLAGPDDELPHYTARLEPSSSSSAPPLPSRTATEPLFRIPPVATESSSPVPPPQIEAQSYDADLDVLDLSVATTQPAIPGRWEKSHTPSPSPLPASPPARTGQSRVIRTSVVILALVSAVTAGVLVTRPAGDAQPPTREPTPDARDGGGNDSGGADLSTPRPVSLDSDLDGSPTEDAAAEDADLDPRDGDVAPTRRDASRPPTAHPRAQGWLRVATRPHYAEVFVDGRRRGTTPLIIQLPAGPHRVRLVSAQLGRSEQRSVVIRATHDRSSPAVVSVEGF
jgi:serine/threonine protein kinase